MNCESYKNGLVTSTKIMTILIRLSIEKLKIFLTLLVNILNTFQNEREHAHRILNVRNIEN